MRGADWGQGATVDPERSFAEPQRLQPQPSQRLKDDWNCGQKMFDHCPTTLHHQKKPDETAQTQTQYPAQL